ncbi:acyltransferase [Nocardioides conyzicola]|uniref:Acyltransferase n=2 Tax=Nocardioides conyzicola TaxID=1651781 RepID=A0ABP8X7S3_9ACTN
MVVVDHVLDKQVDAGALPEGARYYSVLIGALGVATFFVISGYIMCVTTHRSAGTRRGAGYFAARRITRIVPLYWLATAIAIPVKITEPDFAVRLVKSLLFIPYVDSDGEWQPILALGWTLNYEMFFYAVFALCLLLPRRVGLAVCVPMMLTLGALGFVDQGTLPGLLDFYADPMVLMFGVGVLLGLRPWRASLRWVTAPIVACLALPVVVAWLTGAPLPRSAEWALTAAVAVGTVAIALSARRDRPSGRLDAALGVAGDHSYETYLFHVFMLTALAVVWFRLPGGDSPAALALMGLVAVVGCNIGGHVVHRVLQPYVVGPLDAAVRRRWGPAAVTTAA